MSDKDEDEDMEEISGNEDMEETVHINKSNIPPFRESRKEETKEPEGGEMQGNEKLQRIIQQKLRGMASRTSRGQDTEFEDEGEEQQQEYSEDPVQAKLNQLKQKMKPKEKMRKYKLSKRDIKLEESRTIRRAKIISLQGYLNSVRFGPYLNQFIQLNSEQVCNLEDEELDETYRQIRCLLAKRYTEKWVDNAAETGLQIAEKVITPFINIQGYKTMMMANPDFLDCLEELKLGMPDATLPLHVRIGLISAQTAYFCNYLNEIKGGAAIERPQNLAQSEIGSNGGSKEPLAPKTL